MKEIASKINIISIVIDHFETLRNNVTGKRSFGDISVLYLVPAFIGYLAASAVALPKDLAGAVITFFSIFSALLFNLLVLILDAIRKEKEKPDGLATRTLVLLEETYKNSAYAIVVSLLGVVGMLIPYYLKLEDFPKAHFWIGACLYFVFIHFLFVMAMVLKRMNAIVRHLIKSAPSA